ncbi:hypothetical protein [Psychrobacter sp. M13]|uniref:hypothetical protein n=1 Tax=Psychrobacter sp. M13 TaxID=3067275 RepID=UPI00273C6AFE|nr:hypothetical protein [Psychrobacter sp. M13]WLP94987.1 hypothetical protein Q9G97_02385 [Psychrobacter sp. M13]
MNNKLLIPFVLTALATALIGCGEGEDAIFGSSNNELEINSFERVNNNIARIETEYSDGERDIDVTSIIGSFDLASINNLSVSTVLANNFEGTLEDRYIEVNNRTVTRPIYAKNSNERFDYQVTYRTLDLSNKDASSYQKGNRPIDDRGIKTDLNNYSNIPSNISFPSGSVCYVPVTDSDLSFFVFNDKNKTGYSTLNDWIEANEKRFGSNQSSRTDIVNIGVNNNDRAAQVKFFTTNQRIEYNYYGTEFERNIFDADFVAKDKTSPNEDSFRGVIDCTLVNDTAADFLEREIRTAY